jgi:hypothetical protein
MTKAGWLPSFPLGSKYACTLDALSGRITIALKAYAIDVRPQFLEQVHVIGHETADLDRARQLRGQGLKVCEIEFAPPVPRMSAARCRTDKRDPDIAFSVHAERGIEAAHPGLRLLH